MATPRPVSVLLSFHLCSECDGPWEDLWGEIRHMALREPACQRFTLLRGDQEREQRAVLSHWTSADAFHTFVRRLHLPWLTRDLPQCCTPVEYISSHSEPPAVFQPTSNERIPIPV